MRVVIFRFLQALNLRKSVAWQKSFNHLTHWAVNIQTGPQIYGQHGSLAHYSPDIHTIIKLNPTHQGMVLVMNWLDNLKVGLQTCNTSFSARIPRDRRRSRRRGITLDNLLISASELHHSGRYSTLWFFYRNITLENVMISLEWIAHSAQPVDTASVTLWHDSWISACNIAYATGKRTHSSNVQDEKTTCNLQTITDGTFFSRNNYHAIYICPGRARQLDKKLASHMMIYISIRTKKTIFFYVQVEFSPPFTPISPPVSTAMTNGARNCPCSIHLIKSFSQSDTFVSHFHTEFFTQTRWR